MIDQMIDWSIRKLEWRLDLQQSKFWVCTLYSLQQMQWKRLVEKKQRYIKKTGGVQRYIARITRIKADGMGDPCGIRSDYISLLRAAGLGFLFHEGLFNTIHPVQNWKELMVKHGLEDLITA